MPTCLECGFTAQRLQWTHFRYKCTGKFSNCAEYQQHYPGAKLVDDDLAKKQAITLENLQKKYGNQEGNIRWEKYREKQAKSNTFEYKNERYGWSKEQFDEYNKSRSSTLENFIRRYGEENGICKWDEYCERQRYTNTLEYFTEKYGKKEGWRRYTETNQQKAHTIENVQKVHGCTFEEAVSMLASRASRLKFTSDLEQILVDEIEKIIGPLTYTVKTKQYCVWGNNKANFYDIVHNKRAIEFNGDYWHCNPKKYPPNYYHHHGQTTAEIIWENDKKKIDLLETARGIPVLVVWESDFLQNPSETIERCVKWIQSENM